MKDIDIEQINLLVNTTGEAVKPFAEILAGLASNPVTGIPLMAFISELAYKNKLISKEYAAILLSPSAAIDITLPVISEVSNKVDMLLAGLTGFNEPNLQKFIINYREFVRNFDITKDDNTLRTYLSQLRKYYLSKVDDELYSLQNFLSNKQEFTSIIVDHFTFGLGNRDLNIDRAKRLINLLTELRKDIKNMYSNIVSELTRRRNTA